MQSTCIASASYLLSLALLRFLPFMLGTYTYR